MRSCVRGLLRVLVIVALALTAAGPLPRASAAPLLLPGFPRLKQQHSLTCESSAASMGTRGIVSETQLMAAMPRNPNPNLGFRGNPDGRTGGLVDYGVYAAPLHNALLRLGYRSDVLQYATNDTIAAYIFKGWPVVVWVTYLLQPSKPQLAQFAGIPFILVPHEHALLVVGYDENNVYANDPYSRTRVHYHWGKFDRSWAYFGNMALAIEPCHMALPVDSIRQTAVSVDHIRWSWKVAPYAARYRVSIVLDGRPNVSVYQADQTAHHVDLPSPRPGGEYEISVSSLSACGGATSPAKLTSLLPAPLPSIRPTPTATAGSEGEITPTVLPTVTATATPAHG